MHSTYDVIIVGGGHAGIEAAYAAARLGSRTLLLTLYPDKIGATPCNTSIGGIGKGHIVFEISAFGGLMPQLCTQTYLQARMLNTKKGPAVHGLRVQIDKVAYAAASQRALANTKHLTIKAGLVDDIMRDATGAVSGVKTQDGHTYTAPCVILTTGTFLNGRIHIGSTNYAAGREGEPAVSHLSAYLQSQGLKLQRLKTGTPPRLKRSTVNLEAMEYQASDELAYLFEFEPHTVAHKMGCYITATNEKTHAIIRSSCHESPIYSEQMTGTAPRYCPSIEDKVSRFAGKSSHQIFVEPESASTDELYPSGISTSLPLEKQQEFVATIKGFENAVITRPGYAVEYDCILPNQITHSLEVKTIPGLYLAGQINGTTGYEEAAGQGLMAGINASLKVQGKAPLVLAREESYIGVMIDDLVTLSIDEPYRMFTSRAERRLLLRQDNVFDRLAKKAHHLGLMSEHRYNQVLTERHEVHTIVGSLTARQQDKVVLMQQLSAGNQAEVLAKITAHDPTMSERVKQMVYAELLYGPYIEREQKEVEKAQLYKTLSIPQDFTYHNMPGLSVELTQKLSQVRPATIAQAQLITGMTPAAISLLIFKVREHTRTL